MTQHIPERRARTVAWIGFVFQILLTNFLLLLALWGESPSLLGLTMFSGVGTSIWFFLLLVYMQKVRVRNEALESEQLLKERESGVSAGALFDVEDESLLMARRRLKWILKWLLPFFTILVISKLVMAALLYWPWGLFEALDSNKWPTLQNTGMLIWFVGGVGFLAFLLSRYAAGMGRLPEWRMLRAGASWLMGVTLIAVAIVATLAALHFAETPFPERILAKVIRGLFLVLALEILLNWVLDFYRPRAAEEEPRPPFESRLLGLFSEPGGIARSIAEALNYQFGFEVSSTWFYQLLQRALVPLMGFAVLALLAASSLVFVDNNEQAIVERRGRRLEGVLEPGLHLKMPWPIDRAFKVATAQVHELKIGIEPPKEENKPEQKDELILWTNKHAQEPHLEVLVATPKLATYIREVSATRPAASRPAMAVPGRSSESTRRTGEAVAVSLMRVAVSIQFKIRDAYQWLTTYDQPEEMLKAIANREINRYCASVDVNGLIGGQRGRIEQDLRKAIQDRADGSKLGIDLVFLGLQGVHPPESTAQDFQDVVGAEQKQSAAIRSAEAEYNKKLSEVAGDVNRAEALADLIPQVNRLQARQGGDASEVATARTRLNTLFVGDAEQGILPVGGKAAEIRENAKADRWRKENDARARAGAFELEMDAKDAAPTVYRTRKIFTALLEAGESLRKYIVASEGTLQLNLQDPMSASIETAVEQGK